MAGEDPTGGFVAAEVREQLRTAMTVGLPNVVAQRPTFRFTPTKTYASADTAGRPWDWTAAPTATDPDPVREPVQVPCAFEVGGQAVEYRALGALNPSEVTLTLLDEDWAQVEGFTEVDLGGNAYIFDHVDPPLALFDMDVMQVVVRARDES